MQYGVAVIPLIYIWGVAGSNLGQNPTTLNDIIKEVPPCLEENAAIVVI